MKVLAMIKKGTSFSAIKLKDSFLGFDKKLGLKL